MNAKRLLNSITLCSGIFFAAELFAQGYPCAQNRQCDYSAEEIKQIYDEYFAKIGHSDGRGVATNAVFYYEKNKVPQTWSDIPGQTQASDACTECGRGEFKFHEMSTYGADFRMTQDSYLSEDEAIQYSGTSAFVCPSPDESSIEISTINYLGNNTFIGVSHAVLSFRERRKIGYKMFGISVGSDDEMLAQLQQKLKINSNKLKLEAAIRRKFDVLKLKCKLFIIDKDGFNLEQVEINPDSFKNGTYGVDDRENDRLRITTKGFIKIDFEPTAIKLSATTKQKIMTKGVTSYALYAFHSDVAPRKVKSIGTIRPLHDPHPLSRSSNIVGEDVDTSGWASGAFLYDENGAPVCMHLGNTKDNPQNLDYDGKGKSNYCMVVDDDFINFVNN